MVALRHGLFNHEVRKKKTSDNNQRQCRQDDTREAHGQGNIMKTRLKKKKKKTQDMTNLN